MNPFPQENVEGCCEINIKLQQKLLKQLKSSGKLSS
jgi:hypothetical protein